MAFSLLPREDQYFEFFSQMTEKIREAADILVEMVNGPYENFDASSKRIKSVEHECDEITHNITIKLNKSFITPFDREDIYTLSVALDDICDYIDATARAMVMYDIHDADVYVQQLAAIMQKLAGEINSAMPDYVVNRVGEALNSLRKAVNGSRILILGLAYKPNVDDDRESPSYRLLEKLKEQGAEMAYHDPYVPVIRLTREHPHWAGAESVTWNRETISSFDVVVIATAHACLDYAELAEWAPCIVDTRNAMAGVKGVASGKVWKA